MNIIERIQEQLDMLNISPSEMMKGVGLSSGLYTQWKKGMQKPSLKSLQKISDYLDVPLSYFLQDDLKSKAIKKFGFYWDHEQREKIKADARNARDVSFSQEDNIDSFILEFKALFSRSLEANDFDLKHVDFATYIAMLLNQSYWQEKTLKYGVNDYFNNKYGKKAGIPQGTVYDLKEKKVTTKSNLINISQNVYQRPIFASVSAGFGAYASSDIIGYMPILITNAYDVEDTICIKVSGDSMYPKIEDGDIITVRKQSTVDDRQIAVVRIGDEAVVKKVELGSDYIKLISINPEYAPRTIKGSELDAVEIVGLVQQVTKKL